MDGWRGKGECRSRLITGILEISITIFITGTVITPDDVARQEGGSRCGGGTKEYGDTVYRVNRKYVRRYIKETKRNELCKLDFLPCYYIELL